MKVETITNQIIKPSTTTPNDLRTLQLSICDQLISPVYTTAFLFYTKADFISQDHISHKLKTSLSEALTRFHPFAGRINGVTVDCNDEGAVFVEARVDDCTLFGFIRSPDFESLQQLLPEATPTTRPLLLVKSTYFQCGGMAIGIGISHKLADAASLSTFVWSWAAMARGDQSDLEAMIPEFAGTKLYPPANEAFKLPVDVQADKRKSVTKRFVFGASKMEELRVKAASDAVPRPTRVQSVTSLIWRCVAASSSDTSREKVLVQPANLRPKIPSLLSENLIGNLIFSTVTFGKGGEVQISETVKELQERAKELALLVQDQEAGSIGTKLVGQIMGYASKLSSQNYDIHPVTSWCKLRFYDANFGWGSPVWVAGNVVLLPRSKTVLFDSKDGQGIEAWVTLPQEAMLLFERNPDLLAFASPNA